MGYAGKIIFASLRLSLIHRQQLIRRRQREHGQRGRVVVGENIIATVRLRRPGAISFLTIQQDLNQGRKELVPIAPTQYFLMQWCEQNLSQSFPAASAFVVSPSEAS